MLDRTGLTHADIQGHSGIANFGGATGWGSVLADDLGLTKNLLAASGSQLIPGGTFYNGCGPMLVAISRATAAAPYAKLTRLGLIQYGMNDGHRIGSGGEEMFKHSLRSLICRNRAVRVRESADGVHTYNGGSPVATAAGDASGNNCHFFQLNDKTVTCTWTDVPAGGEIDMGFIYGPASTQRARWTFTLDGVAQTDLDLRLAAIPLPAGYTPGFALAVKRFTGLTAGAHTIVGTTKDLPGSSITYFDYSQVCPARTQDVLVAGSWKCTDAGYVDFNDPPLAFTVNDALYDAMNEWMQEVCDEFDESVTYIDTDRFINKDPDLFLDGVHLNQAGHDAIADGVRSIIAASKGSLMGVG